MGSRRSRTLVSVSVQVSVASSPLASRRLILSLYLSLARMQIISVITGITTQFAFGLSNGGPGVMSVGWIIVSFFTM